MIDCSKLENYFAEKKRLTKTDKCQNCHINCNQCPLSADLNDTNKELSCLQLEMLQPQKAIKILQKWSDENPPKTRLMKFYEDYPNAPLNGKGLPNLCPYRLGYDKPPTRDWCPNLKCEECWNQPLKEGEE